MHGGLGFFVPAFAVGLALVYCWAVGEKRGMERLCGAWPATAARGVGVVEAAAAAHQGTFYPVNRWMGLGALALTPSERLP